MRKIKVVVLLVQQLQHGFTKNAKVSPNLTVARTNVTSCVESGSVVDTLDVTRNLDVSLDCACSAEKVYCKLDPLQTQFLTPVHDWLNC